MSHRRYQPRGLPVPSGRISRLARFGAMATGVAGNMALRGAGDLARGRRPSLNDLLLTPGNATRITNQLAQMRGAAMKVGQLLSMEAGDLLPPELSEILGALRADAHFMPTRQLKSVLVANWGQDFLKRFERFDVEPIAAASIGQVHRARTRDGRDLAIKVQYPGVRASIDSDVENAAALIRLSGLLPAELDVAPLLAEAKRQLHEEADYAREGAYLKRFGALIAGDDALRAPELHEDLSTENILAMTYLPGEAVEALTDAAQDERDRIAELLIRLMLREVFDFRLMQTDPNFANYRYDRATGRLLLLDFGATREIPAGMPDAFRRLLRAGLSGDREGVRRGALDLGVYGEGSEARHEAALLEMFEMGFAPLRPGGIFDFGDRSVALQLRDKGIALASDPDFWHIPPMDTLFVQRKVAGVYLLATRLRARLDVRAMLEPFIGTGAVEVVA